MSDLLVARRYATALYDLASDKGTLDAVDADVALVSDTVATSPDLTAMFASPIVSRDKKMNVVKALFGQRVDAVTMDFVLLLIEKGREQILPQITGAYRSLRDEQRGIVEATAKTADPMTESEQSRLREALEARTGKKIRLHVQQDPSIIGGLVVRVGDEVFDGSVRNSLAHLRGRFGLGNVRSN